MTFSIECKTKYYSWSLYHDLCSNTTKCTTPSYFATNIYTSNILEKLPKSFCRTYMDFLDLVSLGMGLAITQSNWICQSSKISYDSTNRAPLGFGQQER